MALSAEVRGQGHGSEVAVGGVTAPVCPLQVQTGEVTCHRSVCRADWHSSLAPASIDGRGQTPWEYLQGRWTLPFKSVYAKRRTSTGETFLMLAGRKAVRICQVLLSCLSGILSIPRHSWPGVRLFEHSQEKAFRKTLRPDVLSRSKCPSPASSRQTWRLSFIAHYGIIRKFGRIIFRCIVEE